MRGRVGGGDARAFGYLRVSTAEQAGSGLGLEAQEAAIVSTAVRLALPLAATFTDAGLSGGLPLDRRPALLEALNGLQSGDVLIVAKRDRLGRDVLNVAMIERLAERKGARIVSAAGEGTEDNGPTSILMRQIIDAFGQYERALIRTRTKAALAAKRARGERVGGVPFGFELAADGRTLQPSAAEQQVLSVARRLRNAGRTLQQIADELNRQGIRTRRRTPWRNQHISYLLAA